MTREQQLLASENLNLARREAWKGRRLRPCPAAAAAGQRRLLAALAGEARWLLGGLIRGAQGTEPFLWLEFILPSITWLQKEKRAPTLLVVRKVE